MAENKTPKISIGITSLTVILCVLCLTVFSVLTVSTALSEREFAEKRAAGTKAYYTAESEAAEIVNMLQDALNNDDDLQVFAVNHDIQLEGDRFYFQKNIDDQQVLLVELRVSDVLEIETWQVVSTAEWAPDQSLNVWDGNILLEE